MRDDLFNNLKTYFSYKKIKILEIIAITIEEKIDIAESGYICDWYYSFILNNQFRFHVSNSGRYILNEKNLHITYEDDIIYKKLNNELIKLIREIKIKKLLE